MPAPLEPEGALRWYELLKVIADDRRLPDPELGHDWRELFDERQQKEIDFSEVYAAQFHHGTTGHNQLMLIASMAQMLDFIFHNFDVRGKT